MWTATLKSQSRSEKEKEGRPLIGGKYLAEKGSLVKPHLLFGTFSLLAFFFLAFAFFAPAALAQKARRAEKAPGLQVVQLTLNFGPLTNGFVEAYYSPEANEAGERFYVSVKGLLSKAEINYQTGKEEGGRQGGKEEREGVIEGFFLREGRRYRIDFEKGVGYVGDAKHTFASEEKVVISPSGDVYASASLLSELFGFNVEPDLGNLSISGESEEVLPIERRLMRQRAREQMEEAAGNKKPRASSLFPSGSKVEDAREAAEGKPATRGLRARRLLSKGARSLLPQGGSGRYSVTTRSRITDGEHLFSSYASLGGGVGVGGGVFSFNANLSFRQNGGEGQREDGEVGEGQVDAENSRWDDNFDFQARRLQWERYFRSSPFFSRVEVGRMRSGAIRGMSYTGLRVSNRPERRERIIGDYLVEGFANPGEEVELYYNDNLVNFQRANESTGRYAFEVPLGYGQTNIEVRIYGKGGSEDVRSRFLRVPYSFLPPGKVRYDVEAGRTNGMAGRRFGIEGSFANRLLRDVIEEQGIPFDEATQRISAGGAAGSFLNGTGFPEAVGIDGDSQLRFLSSEVVPLLNVSREVRDEIQNRIAEAREQDLSFWMSRLGAEAGVTNWLTLKGGAEYFRGVERGSGIDPLRLYGGASLRRGSNTLSVQYAPGYYFQTDFSAQTKDNLSIRGAYRRIIEDDPLYFLTSRQRSTARLNFSTPVIDLGSNLISGLRMSVRGRRLARNPETVTEARTPEAGTPEAGTPDGDGTEEPLGEGVLEESRRRSTYSFSPRITFRVKNGINVGISYQGRFEAQSLSEKAYDTGGEAFPLFIGHERSLRPQLSEVRLRGSYRFERSPRVPFLLRRTNVRAYGNLNLGGGGGKGSIRSLGIELQRSLGTRSRFRFGLEKQFSRGSAGALADSFLGGIGQGLRIEAGIRYGLDWGEAQFRSTVSGQGNAGISTSLRGGVTREKLRERSNEASFFERVRRGAGRMSLLARGTQGQGRVSFRSFLDENRNGVRDSSESYIKGGRMRIENASAASLRDVVQHEDTLSEAEQVFSNVRPYENLNASVNLSTIENPTHIPVRDTFGVFVGPAETALIDVPFYRGHVVQGVVKNSQGESTSKAQGLRILMNEVGASAAASVTEGSVQDASFSGKVKTFWGGSFYKIGIPAGVYEFKIDPRQLEGIQRRGCPGARLVRIRGQGENQTSVAVREDAGEWASTENIEFRLCSLEKESKSN